MTRREQRISIITALYQYLLTGKDIDDILSDNLDMNDKESISFIVNNVVGVINNLDTLQDKIEPLLKDWDFDRLGYIEQAIMLFAGYELSQGEMDRGIVINEAIEISKIYCDDEAPKLINGVLDKL